MTALFITSRDSGAGKTLLAAGLGKYLADKGKKVGYMRLGGAGQDASFMKGLLGLEEPAGSMVVTDVTKVKEAYGQILRGKDLVIIEGAEKEVGQVTGELKGRVIIVHGYSRDLASVPEGWKSFGASLLGVVINKVPVSRIKEVKELSTRFAEAGVKVLGTLPEDRALLAITVGELAGELKGKVLDGDTRQSELVENVMLGAMYVDSGLEYFSRKDSKAVVLRSERPDMQLAALETSVRCLVLTGGKPPASIVLHRAREKKVPVILAEGDVSSTLESIENALLQARFHQEKKLSRLAELLKQGFDFAALDKGLALAK